MGELNKSVVLKSHRNLLATSLSRGVWPRCLLQKTSLPYNSDSFITIDIWRVNIRKIEHRCRIYIKLIYKRGIEIIHTDIIMINIKTIEYRDVDPHCCFKARFTSTALILFMVRAVHWSELSPQIWCDASQFTAA